MAAQEQHTQYRLIVEKDRDILHIRAMGTRTYDSLMAIVADVMASCREQDTHKVLVDVREMKGMLSTWQALKLVTTGFSTLRDVRILHKAAIVDLAENRERYRFLETVANNRGYNLRVFENTDEAIEWLE